MRRNSIAILLLASGVALAALPAKAQTARITLQNYEELVRKDLLDDVRVTYFLRGMADLFQLLGALCLSPCQAQMTLRENNDLFLAARAKDAKSHAKLNYFYLGLSQALPAVHAAFAQASANPSFCLPDGRLPYERLLTAITDETERLPLGEGPLGINTENASMGLFTVAALKRNYPCK